MSLRVLGIDPGFDRVGYGVVDLIGTDASWIHHSCLQTRAADAFVHRLQQVRDETVRVIQVFAPEVVAVEKLFFQTNAKTAIDVSMARGIVLLAIADAGLPFVELTPNQVKQGMTGSGSADKGQVQIMVQRLLKLSILPTPDDAADALAIAMVGGLMHQSKPTR